MSGYEDMILPDGFNPELGDANFNEDGSLVDTPVATTPTTDEQPTETDVVEETNGEQAQEPTIIPEETPIEVAPQTIKVRFNHEDRELTMDEAAAYAQKGMNYDRMEQRTREQDARLGNYERLAKMFGFDNAEAMMVQAEQNFIEGKVKDLVDQGNPEALARFLVDQEMKKNAPAQPVQNTVNPNGTINSGLSAERKAEIDEFARAYPGVKKIPDEVFKLHSEGVRLKTAYEIFVKQQAIETANKEKKAAQEELAILKQNQAAAAKGPVTGTVGKASADKPEADDPFVKGFNSAY